MQTKDINAKIMANIAPKKPRAKKETPSQKRRDITNAKIEALQAAIVAIKDKMREDRFVNDWRPAYYSAITTIELEVQKLRCITSAHNAQVPEQTMMMRVPQKHRKVNNFRMGTCRC